MSVYVIIDDTFIPSRYCNSMVTYPLSLDELSSLYFQLQQTRKKIVRVFCEKIMSYFYSSQVYKVYFSINSLGEIIFIF